MRTELVFQYKGTLETNGSTLIPESKEKFETFMIDLSEEVTVNTGFSLGVDYSLYVNYDGTLGVDTKDDEVQDKVSDYIESKYIVSFERA